MECRENDGLGQFRRLMTLLKVIDLVETFALPRKCARQGALFCFSTETLAGQSYRLQQNGRFAQSPDYIEDVALPIGWKIVASWEAMLKMEIGS
jgi:predicted TPR repeat methyltransferase